MSPSDVCFIDFLINKTCRSKAASNEVVVLSFTPNKTQIGILGRSLMQYNEPHTKSEPFCDIYGIFFVIQFGRLNLAQGAIYLY